MGRQAPWGDIPTSNIIPDGVYEFEIASLEEVQSSTGKVMYKADMRVVEPAEYANWPIFENYVIGSDDDPQAADPTTWKSSMGARNMKTMLDKSQVPLADDMDEVCAQAPGAHFIGTVGQRTTDQGSIMNSIRAYFAVGEKPTGINPTNGAPASRAGAARRPAVAAQAPARAAAPAPAARPAVPARAPARTAPVVEQDPEPEAEPVAAAPAPARRPVGRPAAPAAAPAPAPRAAAAPKEKTLPCGICGQPIAKTAYADHVEQCEGPAAE